MSGVPSVFLRLAGCNLRCAFCDTEEALSGGNKYSLREVREKILSLQGSRRNLVVTGGEPLLQAKALEVLLPEMLGRFSQVEVETNGTLPPLRVPGLRYNVSPKLSNSGEPFPKRIKEGILKEFLELPSVFKFVIKDRSHLEEVLSLAERIGIPPHRIWLMPMARSRKELEEMALEVALLALEYGFRYSDRLHLRLSLP